MAENGEFRKNIFSLKKVKYYNFFNEEYNYLDSLDLEINFNKENIFIKKICKRIDCPDTRISLNSERSLIKKING